MSQELAKINFTDDQIKLIKSQIAPKATDDELKLFLHQCKRTGLDPLLRQIYAIHRKSKVNDVWVEKMTIQTSIDGFRVIAERSGDYGGQDEPEYDYRNDKVFKATVRVYRFRGDQRYQAAVGVAFMDEYKPSGSSQMWDKMPHTMLAKVAEALALRKAYPQDLSGLYTNDEMQQASQQEAVDTDVSAEPDETEKKLLRQLVHNSNLSDGEKDSAFQAIDECSDYNRYQQIQYKLEARQLDISQVQNPSKTEINNHINEIIN